MWNSTTETTETTEGASLATLVPDPEGLPPTLKLRRMGRPDPAPARGTPNSSPPSREEVQAAASSRIMAAAFSPIMMAGALVLPETMVGMIEQSATRRP